MGHDEGREFLDRLSGSATGVMRVASWLAKRSFNVRITPMPVWATKAERQARWQDGGDIEIIKRIEVKRRAIPFTTAEDYPYPSVFIDEVYKVDEALRDVEYWVILNHDMSHMAMVRPSTRRHWLIEEHFDPIQKRVCRWYACPTDFVSFRSCDD